MTPPHQVCARAKAPTIPRAAGLPVSRPENRVHVRRAGGPGLEFTLIDKHVPPLAEHTGPGYTLTDRGRDFYRAQYAAHVAAHLDVAAPHPDGADAELWPPGADDILTAHQRYYRALCSAWTDAHTAHQAATEEAAAPPPAVVTALPAAVAEQSAARYQLWHETAQARAQVAASHADDLNNALPGPPTSTRPRR